MKTPKFKYGRDPNPHNWHKGADALESIQQQRGKTGKKKPNPSLMDRLATIEKLLKER